MVIWFLSYFPNHDAYDNVAQQQENSFLGHIGKSIEPVLEPLGFDWKMGVGIVSGIGAKELVVSSLGVMYADDEPAGASVALDAEGVPDVDGNPDTDQVAESGADTRLQRALVKSVTPPAALAYMVFILLYFPCIATFIAIKQEGGGWKWAILTAVYTLTLAWIAAFITFNIASLFI